MCLFCVQLVYVDVGSRFGMVHLVASPDNSNLRASFHSCPFDSNRACAEWVYTTWRWLVSLCLQLVVVAGRRTVGGGYLNKDGCGAINGIPP